MPIFRVKSVKIYTGQKIYTDGVSRVSDNYQVWSMVILVMLVMMVMMVMMVMVLILVIMVMLVMMVGIVYTSCLRSLTQLI